MVFLQSDLRQSARAFSLVEVTISIAIVAVASISLISALNQSMTMRSETVVREDGTRFESFVRASLLELDFNSVYRFVRENEGGNAFYTYFYTGHPKDRRTEDGTPLPAQETTSIKVQGFRRTDDPFFKEDLEVRVGEAFKIRLTEFPFDPDDNTFELPESVDDYDRSALPVFVEVFQDPQPGENIDEWLPYRRQLSFPVLIPRK